MAFGDFTVDRNSTKYVLGSGGDIISYATDEPAFEFNTDGSYKGLLVEPAATNLALQSEDINTTWGPSNATPTQSTEETPDGDTSNKYIKLVDDGSTGTGQVFVSQTITFAESTKYTASAFFKADQLAFARITVFNYNTGGTDGNQYFGLSGAGSLGTATFLDDSSIEAYPNGWYRCSVTWTQGAGDTSANVALYVADSISSANVDLDGTSSVFVWGAQVEEGPIATSYIPTTTASVTRNKDDITLGSASSLIGQTEGTLYVEVDWRRAVGAGQVLLEVNSGGSDRVIIYQVANVEDFRMLIISNGSTVTNQGESSSSYSGVKKFAFTYSSAGTGKSVLYVDGADVSTDTDVAIAFSSTLTDVRLGQDVNFIGQANMWIRAAALFPRALSEAEAEALTTV